MNENNQLVWIPAGGNFTNDVGANCHVYQYREAGHPPTTLIVDAGLQFRPLGPDGVMRGRAPDIGDILEQPGSKILLLTHGHNDHVAAIPHWIKAGHQVPDIWATGYTATLLEATLARDGIDPDQWPNISIIEPDATYDAGYGMTVETAPASHSVPGAVSLLISTPAGTHFHSGDIKADQSVMLSDQTDFDLLAQWGRTATIHTALIDAAFADSPGYAKTEMDVRQNILETVKTYPDHRVLYAGTGSYAETMAGLALAAAETGRVLVYDGSSFETNLIALQRNQQNLAVIAEEITGKPLLIRHAKDPLVAALPPNQVLALVSGSDANSGGSINLAATGKSAWWQAGMQDVLVTPSGKSDAVKTMEAALEAKGVTLVRLPNGFRDVCEGHCRADDFRDYVRAVQPQTVIPTHAFANARRAACEIVRDEGCAVAECFVGNVYALGIGGIRQIGARPERWLETGSPEQEHRQSLPYQPLTSRRLMP